MARQQATKTYTRNKVCVYCQEGIIPDYKDIVRLRRFLSERGKIVASRKTAMCSSHQRRVTTAIKRARFLALLPYTTRI